MASLSQSALLHHADIFVNNGALPVAQVELARIGYGLEELNVGRVLAQAFVEAKSKLSVLLAAQKQATQVQERAYQTAYAEMNNFNQIARLLFKDNPPVLTSLDLTLHRSSARAGKAAADGSPAEPGHGTGHAHSKTSKALAKVMADWNLSLTNVPTLTEAQQAELTRAGWGADRITAALKLVEDCATADTIQQQRIQEYLAQCAVVHAAELALRKWYGKGAHLFKLTIKQSDPANRGRLLELLGL